MEFIKELRKLGLNDKEAAVYVAALQLGPSPAQVIARKAKLVRATTYVVLDSLMKKALVTKFKEGKKTLFAAEAPSLLARLLEKQEEAIRERYEELKNLLPQLQASAKSEGEKPSVRYFDGVEGLHAIRREMMMQSQAGDVWYSFTPIDNLNTVLGQADDSSYYRQRISKGVKMKSILTVTSSSQRKKSLAEKYKDELTERRYVPYEIFNSPSGMTIFRDQIAIGSFVGRAGGVIIDSPQMASMMKRVFELAWIGAKTLDTDE